MVTITKYETSTCGPCKMVGAELEKVKAVRDDVEVVIVDCNVEPDKAMAANITLVPVLVISDAGGNSRRLEGMQTVAQINDAIDFKETPKPKEAN
jgi:thioredoxin-like negative regulator of GroEL